MRILLLSLNYAPEPTGIAVYSSGLAETLVSLGHTVACVAANPHFPRWKLFDGFPAWRWTKRQEAGVSVMRCPIYIPAKPNGAARIAHYLSFLVTAAGPMLWQALKFRPDVVLCVAPSLVSAPVALVAARLAGAKSWLHFQDFEVEAAQVTDNMRSGGAVARAAGAFERSMITAFDRVSSISNEMCRKLIEKGRDAADVFELRNWAEIDEIKPQPGSTYRSAWGIETPHVALYSGSIARKQGIETIVEVARLLKDRNDLTFVVCGNGPTRSAMEESAGDLTNLRFHDLQPKEQLCELLNLATVHLLPQRADAADLVLPSKLANMLASGRPVVAGVFPGRGLAREVEGAGLICTPDNAPAMAGAVERLLDDPQLHRACAERAVERARESWSRRTIIERFALTMGALVPRQGAEHAAARDL
jgi:colanic acid biosynthesis glycosyl transferase WcaI